MGVVIGVSGDGVVEAGEPRPFENPCDRFDRLEREIEGRGLNAPAVEERGVASGFVDMSGGAIGCFSRLSFEFERKGEICSGGGIGKARLRVCFSLSVSFCFSFCLDFHKNHPNPFPVRFFCEAGVTGVTGTLALRGDGRLVSESDAFSSENLSVRDVMVAVGENEFERVCLVLRFLPLSIEEYSESAELGERRIDRDREWPDAIE